jgi:hypothetical protein
MKNFFGAVAAAVAMAYPAVSAGQAGSAPESARTTATPPIYESSFAGYRRYEEVPIRPWRETNDEVARSPGHGGHGTPSAKEGPAAPKPPARLSPSANGPQQHGK